MTLEELAASLPEELRVRPGDIPPCIAEAAAYMDDCNTLLEAGQTALTIEEWRQARG